jgi:hypothetical protein
MTMHYEETVTAKEVWEGWLYHGRKMPPMFLTITAGDVIAVNIWNYLVCLERGTAPSVEEFWGANPPRNAVKITKQVIVIYMQDKG